MNKQSAIARKIRKNYKGSIILCYKE